MSRSRFIERPAEGEHAPPALKASRGATPAPAGYGHAARAARRPARAEYRGETYYERPALKASPFGWMVGVYMWLAGLGGAAQLIATAADLAAPASARALVRRGRHIALATAPIGAALLIADLHTPQRFYNMLRIFRKTSPMSIGTYVLTTFGLFSAFTVLGDVLGMRRVSRAAQVPAALAGAGMTTYTAALLSATSTPLWSAEPRWLAVRFAGSSIATGAAALSLAARADRDDASCGALDALAMAATAVEATAALASETGYRAKRVDAPLREMRWSRIGALGLGAALPLAVYSFARRSRGARIAASLGILAGGFLMRSAMVQAGNQSALRPRDYFRIAQEAPGAGDAIGRRGRRP